MLSDKKPALAGLAEAGELAFALAYRCGKEFYPSAYIRSSDWPGKVDEVPVFYLFWASKNYWAQYLALPIEPPITDSVPMPVVDYGWLVTERDYGSAFVKFKPEASETELALLRPLKSAIRVCFLLTMPKDLQSLIGM